MSRARYDFSGWATRNNLRCSDGRTIRKNAFKDNDGKTVPLVWNHQHNDPTNVLGHALLENREEGVYAYCTFNDNPRGQEARELVRHGDVTALSIYANQLKHQGSDVLHGAIREVSLVLAGANPGALIDSVLEHGDFSDDTAIIYTGTSLHISHSDDDYDEGEYEDGEVYEEDEADFEEEDADYENDEGEETMDEEYLSDVMDSLDDEQREAVYEIVGRAIEDTEYRLSHGDEDGEAYDEEYDEDDEDYDEDETVEDVFDTLTDKQKTVVYALVGQAIEDAGGEVEHSFYDGNYFAHADGEDDGETVADVFETLTDKQKKVVYALIGQAIEDAKGGADADDEDEDDEGESEMRHNIFESDYEDDYTVLSHADMEEVFSDARRMGSMREAVLAHGLDNIEILYPDNQEVNPGAPEFIKEPDEWVKKVLAGVRHTPFSRIKTTFANITEADARAKGYVKGKRKIEEVFSLLRRVTNPTTIYKKQKIDRDDMVDITDFDMVAWIKGEMNMMLDEERARAYLIGDGRNMIDEDKIDENCIRPIWTDDELYSVKVPVAIAANATEDQKARTFIRNMIKSRKVYRGTGTPSLYIGEDMLTACLLIEDLNGRIVYDSVEKLATALRVKEIISVPAFDGKIRIADGKAYNLMGIMVNLQDYNVGNTKNGAKNLFEDFDIDYNQQKYLIETRESAALVKPYSAVVLEMVYSAILDVEPEDPTTMMSGKAVSALQENIIVNDTFFKGTLKYVTGYIGYSEVTEEQSGHYLALKFTTTEGATTKVQITGKDAITVGEEGNVVLRVENKNNQKVTITTELDGEVITKKFSLAGLVLENA